MLGKIRRLFQSEENEEQLDLREIFEDLQKLVLHNQVKLTENENLIARVEAASAEDEAIVRGENDDFRKRCALRRVKVQRKRLKRLARCSSIYNDNINMQTQISERIEDMRVSGLKTITANMLEEIAVDNEEAYAKHREMINTVNSMISDVDVPESFEDDPELRDLARECGLI
jgi:hypothetical protein